MSADSAPVGQSAGGRPVRRGGRFVGLPPLSLTPIAPSGTADVWRALRRASHQTADSWGGAALADIASEDVTGPLNALYNAVREAASGQDPVMRGFPSTVPGHRLLEALRRGFLEELALMTDRVDGASIVTALRAFETVQQSLDRDCTQRFTGRLAEPDGPELVVEVAHDMRSPLGSILFLAERLRNAQSGPINQIQERQLGLVYSAAFGLSSLASDVIELARGGDRLVDLHTVPFSVSELMKSVRAIVQPIAEEKGLQLKFTPPQSDFRMGHPAALNRVLLNLTTNALKFTTDGSVEVTATQKGRAKIEFSVQDTGRGIPPQVMTTLFDAFRRRVKPGEYFFSSAGLGLSICRKLIEAMGGTLRVETALEQGTRFSFEIDLPQASAL